MLVFAALRPSYSHSVNAVSELGAIGSPNALGWNLIGFVAPGLLLAIAGGAIAASISPKGWKSAAFWLLVLSGLGFAGTGVFPAELRDGAVLVTSSTTRAHFIMSVVHGVAWVAAASLLFLPLSRSSSWRGWHLLDGVFLILILFAVFGLRGNVADAHIQRIAGAIYFAWIFAFCTRLLMLDRSRKPSVEVAA
jgi:hypothetical membrane protein